MGGPVSWEELGNIKGPKGEKGPAGTISSVSSATVPAGTPARATMTGKEEVHLHLELPQGERGLQGPPGVASSASAQSVPPEAPAKVVLEQHGELVHMALEIPRGAPGVNAVPADEAVGTYLQTPGSQSNQGLDAATAALVAGNGSATHGAVDSTSAMLLDDDTSQMQAALDRVSAALVGEQDTALGTATAGLIDTLTLATRERLVRVDDQQRGRATVQFVRGPGYDYEVIRVTGKDGIRKVQAPGFLPDGRVPRANRRTLKRLGIENGYGAIVNADASMTVDDTYARMHGINITGGVPYASFGDSPPLGMPGTEDFDTEAAALYTDGSLRYISRADGKTAAQYVEAGVTDTFGHGPVLVRNGTDTLWHQKAGYREFVTTTSARTILGQAANGDTIIILVHGKTGSYGVVGAEISALAIREGCHIAVNLDGGGSTQGVWDGITCHASTDATYERGIMSAIAITAPTMNRYDTGSIQLAPLAPFVKSAAGLPALSLRARDGKVTAEFNLMTPTPFAKNAWVLASNDVVPDFLCPRSFQESRGTVAAGNGNQVTASLTTDFKIYVRNNSTTDMNLATGIMQWPMRDYLGDVA